MQHKQAYIFFGVSGSGKGTQAVLLQNYLEQHDSRSICVLETGQRFRQLMSKETYAGKKASGITASGGLQPVFLSIWNWTDFLLDSLRENEHLIIDGSPRRRLEPQILETALDFFEYDDVHIIYLDVEAPVVTDRLIKRGRNDDTPDAITRRLGWFTDEVLPMLTYYKENPRYHFHAIDGGQSIEAVHDAIVQAITTA